MDNSMKYIKIKKQIFIKKGNDIKINYEINLDDQLG